MLKSRTVVLQTNLVPSAAERRLAQQLSLPMLNSDQLKEDDGVGFTSSYARLV